MINLFVLLNQITQIYNPDHHKQDFDSTHNFRKYLALEHLIS